MSLSQKAIDTFLLAYLTSLSLDHYSAFVSGLTLVSIVLMHLVCNALRVFLGVMVVALVGKKSANISF